MLYTHDLSSLQNIPDGGRPHIQKLPYSDNPACEVDFLSLGARARPEQSLRLQCQWPHCIAFGVVSGQKQS